MRFWLSVAECEKMGNVWRGFGDFSPILFFFCFCLGNTVCTDCFDLYMTDVNKFLDRVPKDFNPVSAEMEAFALFYVAKVLNKKASCIMSVVDSKYIKEVATPEERQTGLTNMIKLALDSSLKITD